MVGYDMGSEVHSEDVYSKFMSTVKNKLGVSTEIAYTLRSSTGKPIAYTPSPNGTISITCEKADGSLESIQTDPEIKLY